MSRLKNKLSKASLRKRVLELHDICTSTHSKMMECLKKYMNLKMVPRPYSSIE
jgi:hypothetical protein